MGLELQGDDSSIKGAVGIPETPGQALSHQDYGDYSILLSRFSHILRPSQYSLHHQRKVQGPEDLSVGLSIRSSPQDLSVVRRIYP